MTKGNIVLTGQLHIPIAEQVHFKPLLDAHIAATKAEPGCLFFEVSQDPSDPTTLHVSERFRDQAAYDHHQQRGTKNALGQILCAFAAKIHQTS